MTNLGAHHLDIVDWVLGLDRLKAVTSVGGRFALTDNGETPDTQDALFDFGKWTAAFTMRECARGEQCRRSAWSSTAPRAASASTAAASRVTADPDMPPVNQVPGAKDGHPVGGPKAVPAGGRAEPRTEAVEDRSGDSDEQYREHARNFLDCVRSRKTPVSDLASAQRTAVACHLANLSLRLGRTLPLGRRRTDVRRRRRGGAALVRPYRAPWDRELKALGV